VLLFPDTHAWKAALITRFIDYRLNKSGLRLCLSQPVVGMLNCQVNFQFPVGLRIIRMRQQVITQQAFIPFVPGRILNYMQVAGDFRTGRAPTEKKSRPGMPFSTCSYPSAASLGIIVRPSPMLVTAAIMLRTGLAERPGMEVLPMCSMAKKVDPMAASKRARSAR